MKSAVEMPGCAAMKRFSRATISSVPPFAGNCIKYVSIRRQLRVKRTYRRFNIPEQYEGTVGAVTGEDVEGMSGGDQDGKTDPKDELVLEIPMASWNVRRRAS